MPFNAKSIKFISVAAVSAVAAIGAAQAESNAAFSYKASELESTAGVSNLYSRIEMRAKDVCAADSRALYAKKISDSCEDGLVEEWVEGIGDARLNRQHAQNGASQIASVRK